MPQPHATQEAAVLGVDFGGVITDINSEISFFEDNYLDKPAAAGCFAVLAALNVEGDYAGRIHIVSKCGPKIENRTRLWLAGSGFHEETGIPVENLHFTPTRQGKAPIARNLGVTAFIDDAPEVLVYVAEAVPRLILFAPNIPAPEIPADIAGQTTIVENWHQAHQVLTQTGA